MAESVGYRGRGRGRGRGRDRGSGRGQSYTGRYWEEQDDSVFRVKRAFTYSGSTPSIEIPKAIGSFSIDGDRDFGYDRSMLRFLHTKYMPEDKMKVHLDLNIGLDKLVPYKGIIKDSFENFLQWVLNNQDQLTAEDTLQRLSVDFICTRGSIKSIMMTPYTLRIPWTVLVREFKGTFYMIHWKEKDVTEVEKFSLWGHKFEQYMKGDPNEMLDANEEYRCVLKMPLGDDTFLYAPEVDCADPGSFEEDYHDLGAFVTVKCCKEVAPEKMTNYRRYKLSKWYVENKIAGIPRTIIGFRNDDGIVHTLELLETEDLPEKGGNEWDPSVYFNFFSTFLSFLKKKVREDPKATYKFQFEPMVGIRCTKLTGKEHIDILPSWYTEELFNSDDSEED